MAATETVKGGEMMAADTTTRTSKGFPSPFELPAPHGVAGWEAMYAVHTLFADDRREFDESRFWFHEALHAPEPLYPFDAVVYDYAVTALNQASSRLFVIPPSLGVEYRILNGYVYLSANSVTDPAELARRAGLFAQRGGHYYEHWNELYDHWLEKVERATAELEALVVPALPEVEDESVVRGGLGIGAANALISAFDRLLDGLDRVLHYHFELLNLGYGAYLGFYEFCRSTFPEIEDQALATMVSGTDVLVLRPDEELKRLAKLARDLHIADAVKAADGEDGLRRALAGSGPGSRWLAAYEDVKNPWFYVSYGTGIFYHHHRSWIDDPTLPIATIGSYIERLEASEDISRPYKDIITARERITSGYRELLSADTREAFDQSLELARTVFPYVENHNFYVDHRYLTVFWNRVRDFGALLVGRDFLADAEDVFFLRHDEVRSALEELRLSWSSGDVAPARGPSYWPKLVERRKLIYATMRLWSPPPAIGSVPEEVVEPMTVMLFGITPERIRDWLRSEGEEATQIAGIAGSTGVAEGVARVILGPDDLPEVEVGEILVAATTSTSWTPIFGKIAAAVLDTGGIMSHAAIIAREYGLPVVVGTGDGTKRIKTGDRIYVDAGSGVVRVMGSGNASR